MSSEDSELTVSLRSTSTGGSNEDSWLFKLLQVITGGSLATSSILFYQWKMWQNRYATVTSASPIPIEKLEEFFQRESLRHSSLYSTPLPPLYLSISGQAACTNPIITDKSKTPCIWYSHLEIKHFIKLLPFTRWKLWDDSTPETHWSSCEFQLIPKKINQPSFAHASTAAAASASASVASAATKSAVTASSLAASSPASVFVPSHLPADARSFRLLFQQVWNAAEDVSLSSLKFFQQLSTGKLEVKQTHIEHIVPHNQSMTLIGWLARDPSSGRIQVLRGDEHISPSSTIIASSSNPSHSNSPFPANEVEKGFFPTKAGVLNWLNKIGLFTSSSAASGRAGRAAASSNANVNYSYSNKDHPCIISSKSHQEILDEEFSHLESNKRHAWVSIGITCGLVLVLAIWSWHRKHQKDEELKRLLFFYALRKERRELKLKERRDKERRKAAVMKRKSQQLEKEMLQQQQQQRASTLISPPPHPQSIYRSSSSTSSSTASSRVSTPAKWNPASASSSNALSASMRAISPAHNSAVGEASRDSPVMSRSAVYPNGSSSSSSTPVPAGWLAREGRSAVGPNAADSVFSDEDEDDLDDADEFAGGASGAGTSSMREEADDTDSSLAGDDERIGEYCVICAEHKADACLLPCAHLYTCTFCASKLSSCPICRSKVEKIVKVYAQQL